MHSLSLSKCEFGLEHCIDYYRLKRRNYGEFYSAGDVRRASQIASQLLLALNSHHFNHSRINLGSIAQAAGAASAPAPGQLAAMWPA